MTLPVVDLAPRVIMAAHLDDVLLGVLLALALASRLVWLGTLEPNISAVEADQLSRLYQLLAGNSAGVLERPLWPALPFMEIFGPSLLALRLSSTVGSLLVLAVFFLLARRALSLAASLGATTLLAFGSWFLFFSRNGEPGVWVLLLWLAAAYSAQLGLATNQLRHWLWTGLLCGLGWYSGPGGELLLPSILLYLVARSPADLACWRSTVRAAAVTSAVAAALVLPRLPVLLNTVLEPAAALKELAPGFLLGRVADSLRVFVFMDSSLPSNARVVAPSLPVLDSLTATLYVLGLALGTRCIRETVLWWCLLAPTILVALPLSSANPDAAQALLALLAMAFFAGWSIDWLIRRPRIGELARPLLIVAVAAAALWNVNHYVNWQRSGGNALARQPAIEPAEFVAWQTLQLAEAQAGRPGVSAAQWQTARFDQVAATARTTLLTGPADLNGLTLRPLVGFPGLAGLDQPRGLAIDSNATIVILEADGRLARVDPSGRRLPMLAAGPAAPTVEEAADLAIATDGSLLVLDAGRNLIDRYDPAGRFIETLGADWDMYHPRGLAVGLDGRIYVADTGRGRILVARGDAVEQELPELDQPTDVAVDHRGWLYALEPEIGAIIVFDEDGAEQARWAGPRSNTLNSGHLALVSSSGLAVTDPEQRRVLLLDLAGRDLAEARGGPDRPLDSPYAVASAGKMLFVSDVGQASISGFELAPR